MTLVELETAVLSTHPRPARSRLVAALTALVVAVAGLVGIGLVGMQAPAAGAEE